MSLLVFLQSNDWGIMGRSEGCLKSATLEGLHLAWIMIHPWKHRWSPLTYLFLTSTHYLFLEAMSK